MSRIEVDTEALDDQIRELEANCSSFMEFAESVIPDMLVQGSGNSADATNICIQELRQLLAEADMLFHSSASVLSAARGLYADADQAQADKFGKMG